MAVFISFEGGEGSGKSTAGRDTRDEAQEHQDCRGVRA